jgi:hypothetical protein
VGRALTIASIRWHRSLVPRAHFLAVFLGHVSEMGTLSGDWETARIVLGVVLVWLVVTGNPAAIGEMLLANLHCEIGEVLALHFY